MARESSTEKTDAPRRTIALFGAIVVVWWLLDRATKLAFDVATPGTVLQRNVLNLFDFRLVHNTGAAWGMFGDSTAALGVFSLIVCAIILIYYLAYRKGASNIPETIALALVFAGGLGNAFDRLTLGYVVDFIQCTFIDFPVFNVADIGVTCGVVLLLLSILFADHERDNQGERQDG